MARSKPKVAVIMGSDSDWAVMKEAVTVLNKLQVANKARVISAHRTPEEAANFARSAEKEGIAVIIAGAGGAAHLAGVIASWTMLPVIGVPLEGWALGGLDALLSTVQMPAGVPVAAVAVGKVGARNAGILAAQMLALSDNQLAARIRAMRSEAKTSISEKDKTIGREARELQQGKGGKR